MVAVIDIIDDDDAVRDSTHALLETYGYEVRQHSSAEMFLARPDQKSDFLIVDHHMPGMTGLELLEQLRAGGDQTPALMITGRSDCSIVPRAAHIGVRLLNKPLAYEQLVLSIEEVCRDDA